MANLAQLSPTADYKQLLIAIGYLTLIVVAAYFATRFVGNRAQNLHGHSSQIKIIQRLAFARDKSLMLIKAGERYLVIGVTGGQITLLTELAEDELAPDAGGIEEGSFRSIIGRLKKDSKAEPSDWSKGNADKGGKGS